jgi:myosin heavy subunit
VESLVGVRVQHALEPRWVELDIEQELRDEWYAALQRGRINQYEPIAISVWNEYYQPELERRIKNLNKPYDQETDVCGMCPCAYCVPVASDTPQQDFLEVPESVVIELENLRKRLTAKDKQIDNQIKIIDEWRERARKAENHQDEWDQLREDRDHFLRLAQDRFEENVRLTDDIREVQDLLENCRDLYREECIRSVKLESQLAETDEYATDLQASLKGMVARRDLLQEQVNNQAATIQAAQIHSERLQVALGIDEVPF